MIACGALESHKYPSTLFWRAEVHSRRMKHLANYTRDLKKIGNGRRLCKIRERQAIMPRRIRKHFTL